MKINVNKCKVMIFNTGRTYDGMPQLTLSGHGDNYMDVVETFKLLGVIMRSDLKWYENTDYICRKGYSRLWMLRRLKGLGASESELLETSQVSARNGCACMAASTDTTRSKADRTSPEMCPIYNPWG
jgi:hypothetical protein